mmetsp:Transcript_7925/g.15595  ORF Transcript_7925/g.15595 Transcript_7925/m.15595 type:complete len:119 (-) Transcript_7925:1054-1410(-)
MIKDLRGNLVLLNTGRFAGKYAFILSTAVDSKLTGEKGYRYFLTCIIRKHKKKGKMNKKSFFETKHKVYIELNKILLRYMNINHGLVINRKVPQSLVSNYLSEMIGHKLVGDIYLEVR